MSDRKHLDHWNPAVQEAIDRARAEERERIAQAMSEELADRVTWGDGTEYIAVEDAARIARAEDGAA